MKGFFGGHPVLSANNLTFDFKLVAEYQEKRGPKLNLCGAPARLQSQSPVCSLRITLWTQSLRKPLITQRTFPLTSFCFNLNNKPLCYTLAKAFDIIYMSFWYYCEGFQRRTRVKTNKNVMRNCKQLINTRINRTKTRLMLT